MKNSIKVSSEENDGDCDIHGEAGIVKKFLYYLLKIPSHMFQHLL
jgi:hypothetical protein